jgi:hypothetical protein
MFADSFEKLLQMQRENSEEKLKFDTLKRRKERFDRLREGIQQIPKADMSNMQGMPIGAGFINQSIPGMNMGGMPSGLNNAVAGVANDYGYGAEIDDGGFRMFPSEKRIQERQEKIKGQQLEADILEQFNKSRTNPGGGLVNIPGMAIGNMQGLVAQGQGNFNIMNPFTYGNMNRAVV